MIPIYFIHYMLYLLYRYLYTVHAMYTLSIAPGPDGVVFIEVPERAIWEPQSRCKIETTMPLGSSDVYRLVIYGIGVYSI